MNRNQNIYIKSIHRIDKTVEYQSIMTGRASRKAEAKWRVAELRVNCTEAEFCENCTDAVVVVWTPEEASLTSLRGNASSAVSHAPGW